ncbi:hypothetical protein D6774_02650 [Candidatus Woesearchaeota archaeon]|nr:MAG: hypothetical protein D6774_02650 [Candidatus Woesearchaeota archaeon]
MSYLIKIRLFGKAKKKKKKASCEVNHLFFRRGYERTPHITVIQPFYSDDQKKVLEIFRKGCNKYRNLGVSVKGVGVFPFHVVYKKVILNSELIDFQKYLARNLESFCSFRGGLRNVYSPHLTIAKKLNLFSFFLIWVYSLIRFRFNFSHKVIRVTLLKKGKILYEYDFVQKRLLNRGQALSKNLLKKTFSLLKPT